MRRRRLGQHYLVDQGVIRKIVDAAAIQPHERVLEIGTGQGALTKKLVTAGKSFVGYEIDRGNYEETIKSVGRAAEVHLGDAFDHMPEFDVLVASLPYSRSASFIDWLCQVDYDRAVVLLQEEFVQKVQAGPGTRDYRAVSVLAQISSEIRAIDRVGRASFSPPPRVNSSLVAITPKARVPAQEILRIKRLFSLRRRRVSAALAELGVVPRKEYGTRRVYSLVPDEVHQLCSTE
jgi:16S rRNA (adenine1518-N6/adenine1519-N6)-dimethyltransferase